MLSWRFCGIRWHTHTHTQKPPTLEKQDLKIFVKLVTKHKNCYVNLSVKQNRKCLLFKPLDAFHVLLTFEGFYESMFFWYLQSSNIETQLPECTEKNAQKQSWVLGASVSLRKKEHWKPLRLAFILKSISCTCQYVTSDDSPGTGTRDHSFTSHVRNGVAEIAAFVPSSLRTALRYRYWIWSQILFRNWAGQTVCSEWILARICSPFLV